MREITLRQVEVIRTVMLRGTISGAAEHLNVSTPGVSRLITRIGLLVQPESMRSAVGATQ